MKVGYKKIHIPSRWTPPGVMLIGLSRLPILPFTVYLTFDRTQFDGEALECGWLGKLPWEIVGLDKCFRSSAFGAIGFVFHEGFANLHKFSVYPSRLGISSFAGTKIR